MASSSKSKSSDLKKSKTASKPTSKDAASSSKSKKTSKASGAQTSADKKSAGLRGAAPWAARHAEKHAAEARARAALPPPPGSARATLRTPLDAEDLKKKIGLLNQLHTEFKSLKKNLVKNFWEIGLLLQSIREKKLYEAKGIESFEAYLEKETDLGKLMGLRLSTMVTAFQKEAANHYGMDRVLSAIATLESDSLSPDRPSGRLPPPPPSTAVLPLKPPGRA